MKQAPVTTQRREKLLAVLKENGPMYANNLARAIGCCTNRLRDVVGPLLASGTVSKEHVTSARVRYHLGVFVPEVVETKQAPREYAVPVRHVMVPRHRGSTHDNPEMVRVTLPAETWDVRA